MAEIAGQVGVRMFMDAGEFVKGSKAAQREADRLQASLLKQERVLRMGANEAKLYELAISGVSTEQIRAIRTQQETVASLEKQTFGFNSLVKLLRGGGLLIGAKLLSNEFLRIAEAVEKAAAAGGTFDQTLEAIFRELPIIGHFVTAWDKLANAMSGAAKEAERVKRAQPGVDAFKSFGKETETIIKRADIETAPDDAAKSIVKYSQAIEELKKNYNKARAALGPAGLTSGFHFRELESQYARARKALGDLYDLEMRRAADRSQQEKLTEIDNLQRSIWRNMNAQYQAEQARLAEIQNQKMKNIEDEEAARRSAEEDDYARAQRIFEEVEKAQERRIRLEAEATDLYERGILTQQEYARYLKKLASEATPIGTPELAEFGSAEAIRIARRSMTGGGSVEDRQLAEQKRTNDILQNRGIRVKGGSDQQVANF